jgi:MgtC family protein
MEDEQQTFLRLSVALAIGLLIGVERGWKEREAREGERVAGVRTYGLIGLLGGGMALVAERLGPLPLALAFVALAGMLTAAYAINVERDDDAGIASLVAGLLTFVFGALAALGQVAVAAASAVVMTLLLGFKPVLHRWVSALEGKELRAGLKLLLISAVLLPILPDRGYGPWQALNPYQIWCMVVLIAGISFAGYFAIKIAGPPQGHGDRGLVRRRSLVHGLDSALLADGPPRTRCDPRAGHRDLARLWHHVSADVAGRRTDQRSVVAALVGTCHRHGRADLRHGVMLLVVFRRKRRNTGGCTLGKPAGAKGGAQLRCFAHGDHDLG